MNLLEALIDTYLTNNGPYETYFDIKEKTIVYDGDPAETGEPGIDWDDEESDERYIEVPRITADEAFRLMERFAVSVSDKGASNKLFAALDRPKPFRRFKDTLFEVGLRDEWFDVEYQYGKKEIEAWLKELGC
jgi:hypothetical protein